MEILGNIEASAGISFGKQIYQANAKANTVVANIVTIDCDNGNTQSIDIGTSTDNVTINITNHKIGTYVLAIKQHATIVRGLVFNPTIDTDFDMVSVGVGGYATIILHYDGVNFTSNSDTKKITTYNELTNYGIGSLVIKDSTKLLVSKVQVDSGTFDDTNWDVVGATEISASNAITLNNSNIELGGSLTKNTSIDFNTRTLSLTNVLQDTSASRVLVLTASGGIKSVAKSTLIQDLSDVSYKSVDEVITGEKTFIKDGSGGGALFRNNSTNFGLSVNNNLSGTGMFMDNALTGTSLSMFNRASGTSLFMVNEGSGTNQKVNQTFDSTGNTYQVSKQKTAGGAYTGVFSIDNVGNTMLQELEIEQASENTVSDEVLVRGADNKVGFVSKASLGGATDLSNYVTLDGDETITGKKTFVKDASGGGILIENNINATGLEINNNSNGTSAVFGNSSTGWGIQIGNSSTGLGIEIGNYSTGWGSVINNYSSGIGSIIVNRSSGIASKIFNDSDSTGDALIVERSGLGEVFKIDNVGNLEAQQATFKVINEDNTATKVLVADDNGKVGHQNKNTYWTGDNATLSKNIDGITLADNITVTGSYRPAASDPSNPLGLHSHIAHYEHPTSQDYGFQLMSTYDLSNGRLFYRNKKLGNWSTAKEIYTTGSTNLNAWVLYGNTSTAVQSVPANTPTVLSNNGGYYNNNKITDLYNTTTQQLDLTDARQNDNLSIVMEVEIETLANSQVVYMQYRGSIGSVNEWNINLTNEVYYKNQGTRNMVCKFDVPLEFVQDITNPAEITIVSDGALNAKVKYHYLKIN